MSGIHAHDQGILLCFRLLRPNYLSLNLLRCRLRSLHQGQPPSQQFKPCDHEQHFHNTVLYTYQIPDSSFLSLCYIHITSLLGFLRFYFSPLSVKTRMNLYEEFLNMNPSGFIVLK